MTPRQSGCSLENAQQGIRSDALALINEETLRV
jgi:hypothetical protein